MKNEEQKVYNQQGNGVLPCVSGSSIVIPKPKLKFEGLDNISIVGEKDIPLSELFELHLKLENYLKSRIVEPQTNIPVVSGRSEHFSCPLPETKCCDRHKINDEEGRWVFCNTCKREWAR